MSKTATIAESRSAESEVLYSVDGNIATITLNRPERMNTISRPMLAQLGQLLLQGATNAVMIAERFAQFVQPEYFSSQTLYRSIESSVI